MESGIPPTLVSVLSELERIMNVATTPALQRDTLMPLIKLTDPNLRILSVNNRLGSRIRHAGACVTAGGVKTWYVKTRDSTAQGKHTAWAKKQVGKTAHDIDEGAALRRENSPTLR
jgi:hypothetical protein